MKRKFACVIMALVLVISLLPLGAIHTQAASNLNYSESAVSLIKQFEGFHATAYQDVNQWSVGYGTPGYAGQVVTEAQADQALRTSLTSINQAINQFTANNNLYLNQSQHDALVSFSFNCGTDWMTQAGRFREAVVRNSSVNEFLFAISLWANVSSVPNAALINRRLAEANLYLNNVYSSAAPAAYTYVILDPNGGTAGSNGEDKMQAYMSGSNVNILAGNPTKSGYSFGGWFTTPTGGTGVKYLSSATAGCTLYAQYGVPVSVTSNYCYVRGGAGSNYTQINTVSAGTQLVIVETAQVNGTAWGRYIDGWVELSNTNYVGGGSINNGNNNNNGSGTTTPVNTGTVVCTTGVNIRSGPGINYNKVGAAYNGQRISIYETVNSGGSFWGRIGTNQWISLTYVKLDSTNTGNTGNTGNGGVIWEGTGGNNNTNVTYQVGTVTASGLNVRSAPGVGNPVVGSYRKGDQVKIYSQTTQNNMLWGMTDKGWVSMNYISLISGGNNGGNNGNGNSTVIATGVVKANTNLNVRNGAGTGYTKVGSLSGGSVVNIYERVTVGGMEWGRVGTNQWVSLAYVTLNTNNGGSIITPSTGLGTVISSTGLNVRNGAGTNYTRVGSLAPGTQVNIYEVTTVGTQQWGRIGTNQWVCMTYIRMNSSSNGGTTIPSTGYTGRVVNCTQLNVRAAAGTNNAIVGRLTPGTTVTVYELTYVNGVAWGRISTGWVCMQYIQLTSTGSGSNSGVIWQ